MGLTCLMSINNDHEKARNMLLKLLTYRSRSIKEATDYLIAKGFVEHLVSTVINEMINYGYLDDEKFVSDFIAYRKNSGYGLLRIRYELKMKGIDRNVIEEKIAENFNHNEDMQRARELLAKRSRGVKKIDDRWLGRQAAFLKRRGFQNSLIIPVLQYYSQKDFNISE